MREDLAAALDRDGFATCDLLDPSQTAALAAAWDRLDADVKAYPFSATILSRDIEYRRRVDEAVREALWPPIAELLPETRIAYGAFVAKQPGESSAVPIHQDLSFVDEDRFLAVNVWVPLVDVDAGNGCLRVVRGSHRLSNAPRGTDFRIPYLEHLRDADFEDVPLRAGQACLMSGPLYHQSAPNRGGKPRIAAAALVVPEEAQLLYLYAEPGGRRPAEGRELEVFEVPDAFYCRQALGTRPDDLAPVGIERREAPPLTRHEMLARLSPDYAVESQA